MTIIIQTAEPDSKGRVEIGATMYPPGEVNQRGGRRGGNSNLCTWTATFESEPEAIAATLALVAKRTGIVNELMRRMKQE